jgi:TP901 family phage tail tape measure protein
MPRPIDVTLQVKIQDPNTAQLRSVLNKAVSGLGAQVDLKINARSQQGLNSVNQALKGIQGSVGGVNKAAIGLTANLNNLGAASSRMSGRVSGGVASLNQLSKAAQGTSRNIGNVNSLIQDLGESIGITSKRFAAFTVAATAILQTVNAARDAVDQAVAYQKELVRLKQVGGGTATEIAGLSKTVTELSKTLGASSADLIKTSVTLKQAGFTAKETSAALDVLAKTELAATFDGLANTTEGLIAIFNQFKPSANEFKRIFSEINAVSAAYPVEASDIVSAVQKAGGAFKAAGGQLDEFIGLITAVRGTTRESADSIATGLRTIFGRLQRPEIINELRKLNVELQFTKKEADAASKAGDGRVVAGQFVGAFEAVRRLNEALAEIPDSDPRFARLAEQIGGIRQISRTIPLIKEFGKAQEAVNVARAAGNSLDRDAATAQDAFATQVSKLKEEFLDLFRTLGSNASLKQFVSLSIQASSAVVSLAKGLEAAIPLIGAVAAVGLARALPSISSGFKNKPALGSGVGVRRNRGGSIPGSGNDDTVPALLTPGEFVINKKSAQALGPNTLNFLNKFGKAGIQKFASGGRVRDLLRESGLSSLSDLNSALQGSGVTVPKDTKGRLNGGFRLDERKYRLALQFIRGESPRQSQKIPIIGGQSASVATSQIILPNFSQGGRSFINQPDPDPFRALPTAFQPSAPSQIITGRSRNPFDPSFNRERFRQGLTASGPNPRFDRLETATDRARRQQQDILKDELRRRATQRNELQPEFGDFGRLVSPQQIGQERFSRLDNAFSRGKRLDILRNRAFGGDEIIPGLRRLDFAGDLARGRRNTDLRDRIRQNRETGGSSLIPGLGRLDQVQETIRDQQAIFAGQVRRGARLAPRAFAQRSERFSDRVSGLNNGDVDAGKEFKKVSDKYFNLLEKELKQAGINVSARKVVRSIQEGVLPGLAGAIAPGNTAQGSFQRIGGFNRIGINDTKALGHEFAHAISAQLGPGGRFATSVRGSDANRIGQIGNQLFVDKRLRNATVASASTQGTNVRQVLDEEGFAEFFSSYLQFKKLKNQEAKGPGVLGRIFGTNPGAIPRSERGVFATDSFKEGVKLLETGVLPKLQAIAAPVSAPTANFRTGGGVARAGLVGRRTDVRNFFGGADLSGLAGGAEGPVPGGVSLDSVRNDRAQFQKVIAAQISRQIRGRNRNLDRGTRAQISDSLA